MLSLIISIYKNSDALLLILKSIQQQSYTGKFEVIIAEDNNDDALKQLIKELAPQYRYSILHLQQEDLGFRKCKILNEAIRQANGDYLIFIDGDCILHPHFIANHIRFSQKNQVVYGRRVMLSQPLSERVMNSKNIGLLNYFNLIRYKCKRLDAAWYLPFFAPKNKVGFWGCNWSIFKSDIELVSGFDEAYTEPGIGEDTDIEWRLQQRGIIFKQIKHHAIQYHLWHMENYIHTKGVEAILANRKIAYTTTKNKNLLLGDL